MIGLWRQNRGWFRSVSASSRDRTAFMPWSRCWVMSVEMATEQGCGLRGSKIRSSPHVPRSRSCAIWARRLLPSRRPSSTRPWIWPRDWPLRRRPAELISMILEGEPAGCWLPLLAEASELRTLTLSTGARRGRAQLTSARESPSVRLTSLALIHIWRPSGPRTRPHHSPRSRTQ
jgi:hypothetical protein